MEMVQLFGHLKVTCTFHAYDGGSTLPLIIHTAKMDCSLSIERTDRLEKVLGLSLICFSPEERKI